MDGSAFCVHQRRWCGKSPVIAKSPDNTDDKGKSPPACGSVRACVQSLYEV